MSTRRDTRSVYLIFDRNLISKKTTLVYDLISRVHCIQKMHRIMHVHNLDLQIISRKRSNIEND